MLNGRLKKFIEYENIRGNPIMRKNYLRHIDILCKGKGT